MSESKDIKKRVPPGQTLTTKFPVLHYGDVPTADLATFGLRIWGAVERQLTIAWHDLLLLPRVRVTADFHCVTTWSRLDNAWEGVRFSIISNMTGVNPKARHVIAHGLDGYTTNVPLDVLLGDDVLLATHHDGVPLSPEHGGPLRLVVPKLYAWKSAKWLSGIEVLGHDRRGYWEERGYHNRGDPWAEERYSYQETEADEGKTRPR